MPSPFPGMDPYLETPDFWSDLHHELISAVRAQIRAVLPAGFSARVEERLYILNATVRPDVTLLHRPLSSTTRGNRTAVLEAQVGSAVDTPVHVRVYPETVREPYIEIVKRGEPAQVVTAIEILSPSNKRLGAGREEYVRKQSDVLHSDTHLLEIDLLRAGIHTVAVPLHALHEQVARWDYVVCLHRAGWGSEFDTWPFTLRDRLPRVPVPLTEDYPDLSLDLQAAFSRAVEAGGYTLDIDYTAAPELPLSEIDADWADALLRGAHHRA